MQRTSLFGLLAVAMVLITSCSSKDRSGIAIPKDAGFVMHINTASLSSKLSWQEIQQTQWFKRASATAEDSLAKKLLDSPSNTGVNTDADLVFFAKKQGNNLYTVFEGTLTDAATFEAFNKKMKPDAKASKDGDLNILQSEEKAVVTWKDGRFIYVMMVPTADSYRFTPDGTPEPGQKISADSAINFAKSLYALSSSNSLYGESRFTALLKEPGDLHMWVNSDNLSNDMLANAFSMTKLSDLMRGNYSAITLNFENGKIVMSSKSYYNGELEKLLSKYKMKNIDKDMLARLPSENLNAVFSWNYPPDGLKEFLKLAGLEGMANGALGKAGYSVDEFVKANKGDVLIAASDFTISTEQVTKSDYEGMPPVTRTEYHPNVNVLFAVSINDKPAFEKLVGIVVKESKGEQMLPVETNYALNDNWFALGTSKDQVNKFLAGDAGNKHAALGKLAGHPGGFYLDLHKALTTWQNSLAEGDLKQGVTESANMWEDMIGTVDQYSGGVLNSHFEINLVDKNVNSLKQLNQYIDKMQAYSGGSVSF